MLANVLLVSIITWAQGYQMKTDISYTTKTDKYAQERLKLDVYYPENRKGCPVIVWFHGGGLEAGNKEIPAQLKEKGRQDSTLEAERQVFSAYFNWLQR